MTVGRQLYQTTLITLTLIAIAREGDEYELRGIEMRALADGDEPAKTPLVEELEQRRNPLKVGRRQPTSRRR